MLGRRWQDRSRRPWRRDRRAGSARITLLGVEVVLGEDRGTGPVPIATDEPQRFLRSEHVVLPDEGSRCALDVEVQQGSDSRGGAARGRSGVVPGAPSRQGLRHGSDLRARHRHVQRHVGPRRHPALGSSRALHGTGGVGPWEAGPASRSVEPLLELLDVTASPSRSTSLRPLLPPLPLLLLGPSPFHGEG